MDDTLSQLLDRLAEQRIRLRVDGDRLVCTAPIDALTPELREGIGRRKQQLLALLGAHTSGGVAAALTRRATRDAPAPASFGQERLWLLQQLNPRSFSYNIPGAIRLHGPLNVTALEQTLSEIVRRHEVLRTTLTLREGRLFQHIHPPLQVILPPIELAAAEDIDAKLHDVVTSLAQQRIDLAEFPYWRFSLLALGTEDHVLVIVQHHIVSDGWSLGILLHELSVLYGAICRGEESGLPELALQYSDYATWQRERLQGATLDSHLSWWEQQLTDLPSELDLPLDSQRPELQSDRGDCEVCWLGEPHIRRLKEVCGRYGVTPFMTLLAVFAIAISRYSGQNDFAIGTPTGNREHPDCEGLLGFFLNTLAIRIILDGDPRFEQFVRQVRSTALAAFGHQEVPFEKLVETLQVPRDLSRSPIFQVMFIMHTQPAGNLDLHDLTIGPVSFESGTSKYDLTLGATLGADHLTMTLEYCTALFERTTVRRMLRHIRELLISSLAAPETPISKLAMISEDERLQVVSQWNQTTTDFASECTIDDLVFEQAFRTPDRIAACDDTRQWTYQELVNRVDELQRQLVRRGVARHQTVALYMERSVDLLAALLAILRIGATYVPIDDALPDQRLLFIIQDAGVSAIVTQESMCDRLSKLGVSYFCLDVAEQREVSADDPTSTKSSASPHQRAYLIYTSGSTGTPKGVSVSHRAVVNFLASMAVQPGISPDDRLLALTSLTFDISVLELFLPLTVGARVVIGSRALATDSRALADVLAQQQITVMQATPTSWTMLINSGWIGRPELKALCGGEPMPRHLAEELLHRVGELWNLYGPTETTVWSSIQKVSAANKTPTIGRPIANTQLYCLDQHLEPTPIGVPGELYIAGSGLAMGYEARPAQTATSFVPNPFSAHAGERLYRTGDLVRWRGNGQLQFLGRMDRQVKIRGHRIELAEIEHVLSQDPTILRAVVDVDRETSASRLVAWVLLREGSIATVEQLRSRLSERLPVYMVPERIVFVEALPTTPGGKLDRRHLPRPTQRPELEQPYLKPGTTSELRVSRIWQRILDIDRIGLRDNFFDLGGNSLLLASVREELYKEHNREIPMVDLFRYPTVSSLAKFLESMSQ